MSVVALWVVASVACLVVFGGTAPAAVAAPCPGNPDALGVSRVMTVTPGDYPRLGNMQYRRTLSLADREVVLTFDDGPLPPYTDRVLEILARECVKATFFMVGRHAAANPAAARRVYNAGHTIGTHSQNHILIFDRIPEVRAEHEITAGIASVGAALGDEKALAPFFRIPGLLRTRQVENYLQARTLAVWSADTNADDWRHISSAQVLTTALRRLEKRRGGVLLLHDIQPRTVLMLPQFLAELKKRNFRIVHVVPSNEERPALPPAVTAALPVPKLAWPRVATAGTPMTLPARATQTQTALAADAAPAEQVPLPPRKAHKMSRERLKTAIAENKTPRKWRLLALIGFK